MLAERILILVLFARCHIFKAAHRWHECNFVNKDNIGYFRVVSAGRLRSLGLYLSRKDFDNYKSYYRRHGFKLFLATEYLNMITQRAPSLIERMGGAEAASGLLISAVELFYYKLVNDAQLARFFEGKDMVLLKKKQVDFLAYVFGGPTEYSGRGIFEAHEHLIREQGNF
jgi:Bacterial-like globin